MQAKRTPTSDAWSDLVRLLRARPRSVSEVRERLQRGGHEEEEIGKAIRTALDAGLLDDRAVARLWVNDRLWHHPLSRAAVVQELRERGIEASIIDAALDEAGYSAAREVEVAYELAAERFARLRAVDRERRGIRTIGYLTRRGFSAALAREALRRVEREAADG